MRHCFAEEIKTFSVPDPATYARWKEVINGIFRESFLRVSFRWKKKTTNLVGQSRGGSRHRTDKEEEQINHTCIISLLKAASQKSSVAGWYIMINNPGASAGCSPLLPLKQQVPAAELDNSSACKDTFRDLSHQHLTTFNTSMTSIAMIFLFHLAFLLTFRNSQSPAMRLFPFLPASWILRSLFRPLCFMYFKMFPRYRPLYCGGASLLEFWVFSDGFDFPLFVGDRQGAEGTLKSSVSAIRWGVPSS